MKANFRTNLVQLLFSYLAVAKLMYWIEALAGISDFDDFMTIIVTRLINQDIVIILVLIAMFILDDFVFDRASEKGLLESIKLNAVGLVIFLAILTGYHFVLGLFIEVNISSWPRFFISWSIIFAIASAFLLIKDRMKKKETELYIRSEPTADTPEGRLLMLEALHKAGTLTDEEFENLSARI
ncbi:MAG: hypothetical protein FWC70_06455 [Defluviitaleaceae bacterium]|nr:hypothetical protein [Defluviitaleaceae bacterium]